MVTIWQHIMTYNENFGIINEKFDNLNIVYGQTWIFWTISFFFEPVVWSLSLKTKKKVTFIEKVKVFGLKRGKDLFLMKTKGGAVTSATLRPTVTQPKGKIQHIF